jgi:hypothetical protein
MADKRGKRTAGQNDRKEDRIELPYTGESQIVRISTACCFIQRPVIDGRYLVKWADTVKLR